LGEGGDVVTSGGGVGIDGFGGSAETVGGAGGVTIELGVGLGFGVAGWLSSQAARKVVVRIRVVTTFEMVFELRM
jgi:hypothetical protein